MGQPKQHRHQSQPPKRKKTFNEYAQYSGIAIQMFVIIGLGTFVGVKLDENFPNEHSLYTVFCSLFAVLISIYFVIRRIIKISKQSEK